MVKLLIALYMVGVLCLVGFLADGRSPAPAGEETVAPSTAEAFVRQAALNGISQIEHSRAAVDRVTSGDVRQFALQVVDMQVPLQEDLEQLAAERGIALPQARHAAESADEPEEGDADRAYLDRQIELHERALDVLKGEAARGLDMDLRVYAWATATVVEHRLGQARALRAALGG